MKILLLLMGFLDLNAVIALLALANKYPLPLSISIFISLTLLIKACVCLTDPGSIMDLFVVFLIALSIFFYLPSWLLFTGAILLGVKAVRSFGV